MLPTAARLLIARWDSIEEALSEYSTLAGLAVVDAEREIMENIGLRIFFLLINELEGVANYAHAEDRIRRIIGDSPELSSQLARSLAAVRCRMDRAESAAKMSLDRLPYYVRQAMLQNQNCRCAICGWFFCDAESTERAVHDARPTLDHIVAFLIGGERPENLNVTCGLCNRLKSSYLHRSERGRVWVDNFVYGWDARVAACWAFLRDGGCTADNCGNTPFLARLYAVKRTPRGQAVLDNLRSFCEEHASGREHVPY